MVETTVSKALARPTIQARLAGLLGHGYQTSVIRRTILLLTLVAPAALANLLVQYFATRLFSHEEFGVFYFAVTLENILFSGSLVLNVFFTRHLVEIASREGEGAANAALRRIQRVVGGWGGGTAIGVFVVLFAASKPLGTASPLVLGLVVLHTYLSYMADLGRAFLQSRQQTIRLGLYTLVWMILRLLLCIGGVVLFGTVWGGYLGFILATTLMYATFRWYVWRTPKVFSAEEALPPAITLLPVIVGYGLLIAISNLDILVGYFLLSETDRGVYAASSVFPKGILVVTLPLVQMLFAIMVGGHAEGAGDTFRWMVRKSASIMLALSAGAVAVTWLLSPWLCGGQFGLNLCQAAPLHRLLLAIVPLSVLRIAVLVEFVRRRNWFVLWLTVPVLGYVLVTWSSRPGIELFSQEFAEFSGIALLFFLLVQLAADRGKVRQTT